MILSLRCSSWSVLKYISNKKQAFIQILCFITSQIRRTVLCSVVYVMQASYLWEQVYLLFTLVRSWPTWRLFAWFELVGLILANKKELKKKIAARHSVFWLDPLWGQVTSTYQIYSETVRNCAHKNIWHNSHQMIKITDFGLKVQLPA